MTNAMGGSHMHTPQSIFQHAMVPQNSTPQQGGPWLQMPQVPPLSIPWSVPALQQPELVRFTGESTFGSTLHHKRKLDASDTVDTWQTKQFITEEKMAAHFQGLHISSNYHKTSEITPIPSTSTANPEPVTRKGVMNLEVPNSIDSEQIDKVHPRLVLSEELKRMQQEPILPTTLLSKLERPTMALVLWEPPTKYHRILPSRDTPTPVPNVTDNNNNNNNNNNETTDNNNSANVPDLNRTVTIGSIFEPMEL